MLTGLVRKIGGSVARRMATSKVRAAAEGGLGERPKRIYWFLQGKKTLLGFLLAAASLSLAILDPAQDPWARPAAAWVVTAAGILIEWGLLDKAWRNGMPAAIRENRLYRVLASYPAELAGLFSAGLVAIQAGECGRLDCDLARVGLFMLAGLAVQAGLLDSAWRSVPPILRMQDVVWRLVVDWKKPHLDIAGHSRIEVENLWRAQQAA